MPRELDIKAELGKVRDLYAEDSVSQSTNILLMGDSGSGKTKLAETARKPVLIHSFDPGGSKSIDQALIDNGSIIVDSRWEREDTKSPSAFRLWEKEFHRLRATNFFEHIGTFVLDSVTTFEQALMGEIITQSRSVKVGDPPGQREYLKEIFAMRDLIKLCAGLPCDFILTAHLDKQTIYDEERQANVLLGIYPMVTKRLRETLPLLFDEKWVIQVKPSSSGPTRKILTQNDGLYQASSRIATHGKGLEKLEELNIERMLRKTGNWKENLPLMV